MNLDDYRGNVLFETLRTMYECNISIVSITKFFRDEPYNKLLIELYKLKDKSLALLHIKDEVKEIRYLSAIVLGLTWEDIK